MRSDMDFQGERLKMLSGFGISNPFRWVATESRSGPAPGSVLCRMRNKRDKEEGE